MTLEKLIAFSRSLRSEKFHRTTRTAYSIVCDPDPRQTLVLTPGSTFNEYKDVFDLSKRVKRIDMRLFQPALRVISFRLREIEIRASCTGLSVLVTPRCLLPFLGFDFAAGCHRLILDFP